MTVTQWALIATAFIILAIVTLMAQFRWLPDGRVKSIVLFVAGVTITLALRAADMPPTWFSGSAEGFSMAILLTIWALVGRTREERAFGFPLLSGMGLSLLLANIAGYVSSVL